MTSNNDLTFPLPDPDYVWHKAAGLGPFWLTWGRTHHKPLTRIYFGRYFVSLAIMGRYAGFGW